MACGNHRGARTTDDNARRDSHFAAQKPMDPTIQENRFYPQARRLVKQIKTKTAQ